MSENREREARQVPTTPISGVVRILTHESATRENVRPGDIALIDANDLDRAFASRLISLRIPAVLNAQPSISGRTTALGAATLLEAGVLLIDDLSSDVLTIRDGDTVFIDGTRVFRGEQLIAEGSLRESSEVQAALSQGARRVGSRVQAFSMASPELFAQESELIENGLGLPELGQTLQGKVTVVLQSLPKGFGPKLLRRFVNQQQAQVIAVGAQGAELANAAKLAPVAVVGHADWGPIDNLRKVPRVISVQRSEGESPAEKLLRSHSIGFHTVHSSLNETAIALLIAAHNGASAILESSDPQDLHSLVDSGSTTFNGDLLVRAQLSGRLAGFQAVQSLAFPKTPSWLLALLVVVGVALFLTALLITPMGQSAVELLTGTSLSGGPVFQVGTGQIV